jgi:hypothetical protein
MGIAPSQINMISDAAMHRRRPNWVTVASKHPLRPRVRTTPESRPSLRVETIDAGQFPWIIGEDRLTLKGQGECPMRKFIAGLGSAAAWPVTASGGAVGFVNGRSPAAYEDRRAAFRR